MENKQKGASLYFALDILSILMAIVVALSTIIIIQLKTIKEAGDSVVAFYAADTGIEKALYEASKNGAEPGDTFYGEFEDDFEPVASYQATIIATSTTGCPGKYYCIKSTGTYIPSSTKRAIQIKR